jgi:hypothetical protein
MKNFLKGGGGRHKFNYIHFGVNNQLNAKNKKGGQVRAHFMEQRKHKVLSELDP